MYIKNLRLINEKKDSVIRDVEFHSGVNFIVDANNSKKHNKVGKTTFLKLIDIALGAKDKKYLYFDSETNSSNKKFEEYIKKNKISVELTLTKDEKLTEKDKNNFILYVGLYPNSKRLIDGVRFNYKEYNEKLNEIFFENENNIPTFRELVHSFVRISLKKDDDSFLKNIPRTSNQVYRSIYNYLFNIADPVTNESISSLNKKLKDIKTSLKSFQEINGISSVSESEQILSTLKNDSTIVKSKLNDILSRTEFEKNRKKINEIRSEYTRIIDKIADVKFNITQIEENIRVEKKAAFLPVNNNLYVKFFDEINRLIPDINKTFDDLIKFNAQLNGNKIEYYNNLKNDLTKELTVLESEKNRLLNNNRSFIALIEDNKIDEYEELSKKLVDIENNITTQRTELKTLVEYKKQIEKIQKQIGNLKQQTEKIDYEKNVNLFNEYFRKYANQINGEHPLLTYNPDADAFPLSIRSLDSGTSTGTRKSLIAAYDLAYQKFAEKINKSIPNFIIHDVLENIEGENLKSIINIANLNRTQYIVAILKEKLDSSDISSKEQKKLTLLSLSQDKMLFND
ncbi:DUF2326 domain-containing protein [Limosilactobacillus sp. RRLNB_1_1]|uniref:DUF2326 domain-containing protein n=1 Tax=Limosilactobacillus albertensis TaxID=2759752 RepID=A0A7W3TTS3_9LACO|nr:DUF2326 domain-containing protein [Limosilactobacillus albertensis]MBB1070578.1 DUF2326 domain-containing protein [Limosilactobacillus albertensis]MCD7118957.1 DUF2326 domain-containing protein [Limosilactobacillus albertensis]MCD7129092.1 DUF2326 domain-containing protein [Limosilactobacillus albertensis]